MKKILLAGLLLLSGYTVSAQAVTHYRWPIDYFSTTPNEVSRWHDHTAQCGYLCRYDGVANPGAAGHPGTDIRSNGTTTAVRAGAMGNLYFRKDGCGNNWGPKTDPCSGYGNHVRVQHPDGKVSIYAHLQSGSVSWYASVLCGYQVGIMGNSGSSTATHLHFELWENQSIGQRIDPFGGAYSGLVYWLSQNENGYGKPSFRCE